MTLTIHAALSGVAHCLTEQIGPALQDLFAIEAARLAAAIVTIAANAADDAAAIRVAENARLRALFGEAGDAVASDAELAIRLREAAQSRDPGLRISELDGETARLRAVLVDLHAHVERSATAAAKRIDAEIWTLLEDIEEMRAPRG